MIIVGKKAPDFKLQGIYKEEFKPYSLEDFKGKWLVLFFYPLDFTFVCPTELIAFNNELSEFKKRKCEVVAVSVDSVYSHLAWLNTPKDKGGIKGVLYPILSDINKTASRDYGVLIEENGISLRGLFIIDPDGLVQSQTINNLPVGRNVDEAVRLIDAFQTARQSGEVCPANWRKGKDTMKPTPKESLKYFEKVAH